MDCAIVKRETLGKIDGQIDPSRLADRFQATCYRDGDLVEGDIAEVLTDINVRQYFPRDFFDDGTYCKATDNCEVLAELRSGAFGVYAVYIYRNRPGRSKSIDDPFKVTVSRFRMVVQFSQKPDVVVEFGNTHTV